MRSAGRLVVFVATVSTGLGVAVALPTAAHAVPRPFINLQGQRVKRLPGKMIGHAYAGTAGHLGCQIFYHTRAHPKLIKLPLPKPLDKDDAQVHFKLHKLNLKTKYYFDLKCGKPLRTVDSDSAFPDQEGKDPSVDAMGASQYKAHNIGPANIRIYAYSGRYGHAGCVVYQHEEGKPKLVRVHPHGTFFDRDNQRYGFYRHHLDPGQALHVHTQMREEQPNCCHRLRLPDAARHVGSAADELLHGPPACSLTHA